MSPSHQSQLVRSYNPRGRDKADEVHVRGSKQVQFNPVRVAAA